MDATTKHEHVSEQRGVRVTRTEFERYRVTTKAGVELEFGRGERLVDPGDMLLAGLAGCMAVSIDKPLTRAAEDRCRPGEGPRGQGHGGDRQCS